MQHIPFPAPDPQKGGPELTAAQAAAVTALQAALDRRAFHTELLYGVTGSGKTEVYLRLIERALAQGRSALLLVPEIALTPQLGEHFRRRFGAKVATFHSGLSVAERRDEWQRVHSGEARIGLGARSALFLPLVRLGIIVVDEEHETSYKQDESPRYHARDLAVYRGRQEEALVVLGSATPSLETYVNCQSGRYGRQALPERVGGRPLPEVTLIDLAKEPKLGEGVFSAPLAEALERNLTAGQQAILFLNRRGFAPYVCCHDCGHAYRCDACDVALTLHRRRNVVACHYCGLCVAAPDACASCHGHRVGAFGLGTEKVEAELARLFACRGVLRLDRDTVRSKVQLDQTLRRFRDGEAQVLIGTQMVAKGHDFPGVTLVGVISADASLNFPDFRAAERTFQLLTQVAGRAGRGQAPGTVLVQAFETQHYAVQAAQRHDFETFVAHELRHRQELHYPPFAHLALLRLEGANEAETFAEAGRLGGQVRELAAGRQLAVDVLGPAVAPLGRLRGQYRVHVLLKGKSRPALRQLLRALPPRPRAAVRRILDVDPVSML